MAKVSNPFAFTRGPVTVITTAIYIAIVTILIVISTGAPSPPSTPTPYKGINLTEAWNDLQVLSAKYHPYNSRQNDVTRAWLLQRIRDILESNNATSTTAYIFDDKFSNLTFTSAGNSASTYHEGLNIVVYVRGANDDKSEWWTTPDGKPKERNGVLVNAHFDSVSTGFGATDDGVGVISVLQLLKYFTTSGQIPQHGLVLLLNNGEEDFLNGANVFSQHPMANFVSSFLNLEGAGAGGRAVLFRTTDEEVTKAYANSPYPFGTVISGDAFKRGLVRSQTDYVVFQGNLGLRGLDVAFYEPRARYHTDQDDSRHTGKSAIWHMLSAAVATTSKLTASGINIDDDEAKAYPAMWFDLFGRAMLVMQTHTFFALAVTVLVIGPILLSVTLALLYRADKMYLFSGSRKIHTINSEETVHLNGWRGYFRFPLILVISSAAPVALAFLMFKYNPYIAHGNEWSVWATMVSSFLFVAWFLCRGLDFARPSALTRAYGLSWLVVIFWAVLVAGVVFEEQFHLAGTYFTLFYFTCILFATFVSYLELFSLPKKSKYCAHKLGDLYPRSRSRSGSRSRPASRSTTRDEAEPVQHREDDEEADEATERSSLLRNRGRSSFKNYTRPAELDEESNTSKTGEKTNAHREQEWSEPMWTWLWVLQFLILAPLNIIILGQIALFNVASLHQTGQDGSSMFTVYLSQAVLTILIFVPLLPLLHRFTWHVPIFLLLVLIATLIYNLLAFPFSPQNRVKLYFLQEVDLATGANNVSLSGVPYFTQDAISYIPSTTGQQVHCSEPITWTERTKCVWSGPMPKVAGSSTAQTYKAQYKSWVNYNVTLTHKDDDIKTARFMLHGKNTRACKIQFDQVISDVHIVGQAPVDDRFPVINEGQTKEIRLWHREWDRAWTVDVSWKVDPEDKNKAHTGRVVCMWSDDNQHGVIPALDEVRHYVPDWVAVSKAADGLVEGFKSFRVNSTLS